jgi:hypothetical protein
MKSIEILQTASAKSQEIVANFQAQNSDAPDVIEARKLELKDVSKADLLDMVIKLEKPKVERAFRVEDVIKEMLCAPELAIFNYDQIAALVIQVLPEAKTTNKSVASYASKKKAEWPIAPREKLQLSTEDILAMASNA